MDEPRLWIWGAPRRAWRLRSGAPPHRPALADAERILVIRPDELGDLVLSTAFLRELRRAAPAAGITLLVKSANAELAALCPYVDAVASLGFDPNWSPQQQCRLWREALRLSWRREFRRGFDLVLLPRRDADWARAEMVAHYLAGRGAVLAHRESAIQNTQRPPPQPELADACFSNPIPDEYEATHNLSFLRWLGASPVSDRLELWFSEPERAAAEAWLARRGLAPGNFIVLHPSGGRSTLKQWPRARFAELHAALLRETSKSALVIGGPDETWIAAAFPATSRTQTSVGELSPRQLAAVLSHAALFVGGDSGPLHIAAAAGAPVVGVFGSTSIARFAPRGARAHVVSLRYACSPDTLRTFENRCQRCRFDSPLCLHELPTSAVLKACRESLTL